ncbi:YopD family type III secretion system translocon subunit [Yersinia enterocolitica]|uniref:YopD family type III secretion system translocon subunit n=1 Tax=Yersinia enterocolitica TaxID=630 RepID=UPI003D7AC5B6
MTDSKPMRLMPQRQPLGQMANSAIQVHQGYSQAEVKEKEVNASIAANEKQKAEEAMNYNDNFMKDVLRLIEQYVSSHTTP